MAALQVLLERRFYAGLLLFPAPIQSCNQRDTHFSTLTADWSL